MSGFQLHLIEPRDPLIARDGRPFTPDPGARATTLPFPFPSTTTGGLRTRAGQDPNGVFDRSLIEAVKRIAVRGPLLTGLDQTGQIEHFFFPAPLDALFLKGEIKDGEETRPPRLKRLVPAQTPSDIFVSELPGAEAVTAFSQPEMEESKPDSGPAFWRETPFFDWLRAPDAFLTQRWDTTAKNGLGLSPLPRDTRTHVALNEHSYSHDEGRLFSTCGLEFRAAKGQSPCFPAQRLALALWHSAGGHGFSIREGAAHLGGERRLVAWRAATRPLPRCDWATEVAECGACRLILTTPAFFADGWRPQWLLQPREGVMPHLVAACVGRPDVVSGWDFLRREPKPTRRLAPAGSTYFLKLQGGKADIEKWIKATWLHCVSDTPETRDNGFGLAVIGVWNGELQENWL